MALLPIQIFGILIALFTMVAVLYRFSKRQINFRITVLWAVFWLVSAAMIIHPRFMTQLANAFGVGRGVDVLIYISLLMLFYFAFRTNVKIEKLERNITKLVREMALEKKKK